MSKEDHRIDMKEVADVARASRPKVIVAGWSAISLWVDMAHFAGLVAADLHPSPVPYADVVPSTVHKTLGGQRSGLILAKQDFAEIVVGGLLGRFLLKLRVLTSWAVDCGSASSPAWSVR